uniref:Uncharacterized protein n=1 Tax=Arundo donax TaxID=35708 RepID=A0A0A9BQA8_ARUDO
MCRVGQSHAGGTSWRCRSTRWCVPVTGLPWPKEGRRADKD